MEPNDRPMLTNAKPVGESPLLRRLRKTRSLDVVLGGHMEAPMSAERSWIGEPQPEKEWSTPWLVVRKGHRIQPFSQSSSEPEAAGVLSMARP